MNESKKFKHGTTLSMIEIARERQEIGRISFGNWGSKHFNEIPPEFVIGGFRKAIANYGGDQIVNARDRQERKFPSEALRQYRLR